MHTNLFSRGHSKSDVRMAMSEDQKQGSRMVKLFDLVLGVCLLVLVRDLPTIDAIAVFVGVVAALSGLRYFVDQSVRNFYLHRLDWDERDS